MSQLYKQLKADQRANRILSRGCAESKVKARILTTLLGELEGKTKGTGVDVTDELCQKTIKKFIKGLNENISVASYDQTLELSIERDTLESYQPEQLNEVDLLGNIKVIIATQENPTMGSVLKQLQEELGGRYNGGMAAMLTNGELL